MAKLNRHIALMRLAVLDTLRAERSVSLAPETWDLAAAVELIADVDFSYITGARTYGVRCHPFIMFNYLVLLSELALLAQAATYKSLSHTAYAALQNPARGPLGHQECHLSKQDWFTDSDLQYSVDQGQVMHNIVFYLDNHVDGSAITDAELTALDKQFALYRQKGLKGAFRFAYTLDVPPAVTEPDLAGIQKHTQQLKALLAKYQDVVYSLQQGWVSKVYLLP